MRNLILTTAAATLALGTAAAAQTAATASTDLNVRSGPGVQHEVIGAIPSGAEASVAGCIESANWCQVTYDGLEGWAYGEYLNVSNDGEVLALTPNRETIGVTVIEAPAIEAEGATGATAGQNAAVGGTTGAAMGALIAGPVGAVVGAAIGGGAAAAATVEPTPEVTTYVTTNSVDPIFLDGEVVVGAGVPETVEIYEIPDQPEFRYAQINNQTVLVNPNDRQIVYIYR